MACQLVLDVVDAGRGAVVGLGRDRLEVLGVVARRQRADQVMDLLVTEQRIALGLGPVVEHEAGHPHLALVELYRRRWRFDQLVHRSEEHTSELQSLMRISYAVFCLKKKNNKNYNN